MLQVVNNLWRLDSVPGETCSSEGMLVNMWVNVTHQPVFVSVRHDSCLSSWLQARDGDACQELSVFCFLQGGGLWKGEAVAGDSVAPGQSHEGHPHHEQDAPVHQLPGQGGGLAVWCPVG